MTLPIPTPFLRLWPLFVIAGTLLALAALAVFWSGGSPAGADGGYEPNPQVVADVRSYAQETQHGHDHVLRWMRVLKTFGALEDMTAAEAQGYADRGWQRWDPVADELTDLENAQGQHQPDQQVIADVRSYAQETERGYTHVLRWMRVLKTFGELEDMTAARPRAYADTYSAERWDPVVAELTAMEANSPATGAPTITGTARVGETLSADTSGISDADGLANATFSYQWLADDADISGATGSSYTLADDDEGKAIKVRVSFTDDAGHDETLTSAATAAVAAATPPSVTGVAVTSTPGANSTYARGETIRVALTFGEAVDVTGTPHLKIDMDPADWGQKWASYESGSGTASLTFAHTVVEPNISTQGIAVLANTLELNGGTIQSSSTQANADLAHEGLGHDGNHRVDWRSERPEPSPESEPPGKPNGLTAAVAVGSLDVAVDWNDVEEADDYLVRWRLHGPGQELNEGVRVASSETWFTVADYGRWVVRVEACNDAGCGPGAAQVVDVTQPEPVAQSGGGCKGELCNVLVELSLKRPAPAENAGGSSGARGTRGGSGQSETPQTTSIVYVIDDSGSMDGDFPEVRATLETVRDTEMGNTKVALIAFGTDATTVFELTDHPEDAQSRPGPWTDARINEFGGKLGGTNYQAGLEQAKAILDADTTATTKKIVFLTDGQNPRPTTVVQSIMDAGIIVDTIGFGDHFSENFTVIEAIAADTNGVHRTVSKPSQGTTNTPEVAATSLSDILEGTVADNTATLFLVDYSFSVYLPNTNTLEPALNAAADKAGASSGVDRQVGLARFLGGSSLLLSGDSEIVRRVPKYHVVKSVGSASLSVVEENAGLRSVLRMEEAGLSFFSVGSTDIDNALQQAYSTISAVTATNKRVVLITDGISATAVPDSTLNSYTNDSAVTLDVVAWGAHADRVQLKTWADSANGTFNVAKWGPAVPKGFRATAGDGTVALGWNDPGDSAIIKYQYRHWLSLSYPTARKTEWMDLPATGADTTTHIITGIPNGYGLWALEVRATYDDVPGGSASSFYIDHWLKPRPEKGMGLTATPGDGQIALNWTTPGDRTHFKEYQYAQREGDGAWSDWMTISGANAATTSHTVTGLTNGTSYSIAVWMVREMDGATGYGPLSSVTATPSD